MRDLLDVLGRVWESGNEACLATVVRTFRSAPRDPGSSMLVEADGSVWGSISGGCVEAAVYHLAEELLATGGPPLRRRYGVSDEVAGEVGLTCGGTIDVFLERFSSAAFPGFPRLADALTAGRPIGCATVIGHPDPAVLGRRLLIDDAPDGTGPGLDRSILDDGRSILGSGLTTVLRYGRGGERFGDEVEVFVTGFRPPSRVIVFGAIDHSEALAAQMRLTGARVTVCDARPVFATSARVPSADEVVVAWPHRYLAQELAAGRIGPDTALCVLTHDPKFDVPLLAAALRLEDRVRPGYIGAMGSRRTHEDREDRLRQAGLSRFELDRLSSPIGLALGGRSPHEVAVAIAAEIIAVRHAGSGDRMRDTVALAGPAGG